MATLSMIQVGQYAYGAGFRGQALRTIVAIAQAESGFDPNAHNPGHAGDPEDSWGLWQININAHHDVTAGQAQDPAFAASYSFRLYTAAGNRFTDWGTYNRGDYLRQPSWLLMQALINIGSFGVNPFKSAAGTWTPQQSLTLWPWATRDGIHPAINNPYHSGFEASRGGVQDGVGMSVPNVDTPITSLTSGTVVAADFGQNLAPAGANWNYGGFIIIKSQIPGVGWADVFYRHMDTLAVSKGDTVGVGTILGLSGGQTSGGHNPESTVFSTGPHIDVGLNPDTLPFTSIGPNLDPTGWLTNLIQKGPSAHDGLATLSGIVTKFDQAATGTGPVGDSFLAIAANIDYGMGFIPIDWSTLSSGTSWWDYLLPWQWGYTASTITGNLAGALFHDIAALIYRLIVLAVGLIIIVAWVVALVKSLTKVQEVKGDQSGRLPTAEDGIETPEVSPYESLAPL